MTNKAEIKPQPRYFFCWKRTNTYDQQLTLDALSIIHSINPSAHAKLICITEKFQNLFGSIYLPQQSEYVSPLYEFLVWRQMASDYISPDFKRTDYLNTMQDDLTKGYNKFRDQKKIGHINSVANRLYDQFFKENSYQDLRRYKDRVKRLQDYEAAALKRMQYYMRLYKERIQTESIVLKDEVYIKLQFEMVLKMEILTFWQQLQRWRNFQALHEKSFCCQIVEDKRNRPYLYSLKLNRPSSEAEPVLMRASEWVQLRTSKNDNTSESEIFIKDLIEQLKKYHLQTSQLQGKDEDKVYSFYPYVSPEFVLFDQITLRPKLSYEPLLHELFGLRKKPTSVQGYIVWFCTPKEFDYFQGEDEFDKQTRLRLTDPFHGVQYLYSRAIEQAIVKRQRQILQGVKERMSIDRFLLTSHYLLYGTEFGRPQEHTSYAQIESHFLQKLREAKSQIIEDANNLSKFVGQTAANTIGKFNFRFGELVQCLSTQENDSTMQANRYLQTIRYLNLRYTFVRELVATLTNDKLFHRISNAKKYIMIYLIIGIQYLEELRLICLEGSRTNDIPSFKRYLEDTGKKLKNGKSVEYSLQSTYIKIQSHQKKATQEVNKFMLEQEGKKLLEGCKQLTLTIKRERDALNKVCNMIEGENRVSNYKQQIRQQIILSKSDLPKYIGYFGRMLGQFSKLEMKIKYPSGPHKPPQEKNEKIVEYYNLVTRRFELLTHALLTSTQQNYLIYDSLVARVLHADEQDYYPQSHAVTPEFLKTEREAQVIVDDIIGFSKPKAVPKSAPKKEPELKKGNSKGWGEKIVE